jgi:lycopene beta-cyclase
MSKGRAPAYDVVIVGGGLAGQLCVLALSDRAPSLSVALIERGERLGGNQTWCCHGSDLSLLPGGASTLTWLRTLADRAWPGYQVRFPRQERVVDGDYLCLRSVSLARACERSLIRPGCALLTGQPVGEVSPNEVSLVDGTTVTARVVLDARGGDLADFDGRCGYQKFVGWEIELDASSGAPALPVLMDATVEQLDGYRFAYVLPFSSTTLLVEDTYFSREKGLDLERVRTRLRDCLRARGWANARLLREEAGILPMPWSSARGGRSSLAIGYRGGFFHPGTGYSLPRAALVADTLARLAAVTNLDGLRHATEKSLDALRSAWQTDDRFGRWLNWLAFRAVPGRWLRDLVFENVYRLPAQVLARFYAGRTSRRDRIAVATAPVALSFLQRTSRPLPLPGETT